MMSKHRDLLLGSWRPGLHPIGLLRTLARAMARYIESEDALARQPGAIFFPKGVIEKPEDGEKGPDGASLAYIQLASEIFLDRLDESGGKAEGDKKQLMDLV